MKATIGKISTMSLLGCIAISSVAQTTNDSYTKVYKAQVPLTGNISTINNTSQVIEGITYYDGLGRPIQVVAKRSSPGGKDVVTISAYDRYGKNTVNYLPYASTESDGNFKQHGDSLQQVFYETMFDRTDASQAFSTQVFEHSELSRPIDQSAPGDAWKLGSHHTVRRQYSANTDADSVYHFYYDETTGVSVIPGANAYYQNNTLICNKTIDEEKHDVLEFVDREGRTVCKKVNAAHGVYAYTFYVYDKIGNLVTVIPPEGIRSIRQILNAQ
jgi:hypothetical protein